MPEIHQLEQKMLFVAEAWLEQDRCSSISLEAFSKASGIDRERLRDACKKGRVSDALETSLCEAIGFSKNELSWRDVRIDYVTRAKGSSRYYGVDTAEHFRVFVRKLLGLPVMGNAVVRSHRPRQTRSNVARMEVSGGQAGPDGNIPLVAQIVLSNGSRGTVKYGFHRVRLRFEFDADSPARLVERLGLREATTIADGSLTTDGGDFSPAWYLAATTSRSLLEGQYNTFEKALCSLSGAHQGEEIVAELAARPSDGDVVYLPAEGASAVLTSDQNAILRSLFQEKLTDEIGGDGWIGLASQKLTVALD
jgi:hypothetical protein